MHALQLSNVSFALRRLLVGLLSLAVLATLWHLVVVGLRVPAYLAPTPSAILHAAIKNWKILAAQTGFTLGAAAIGLSISTLFAVGIAVAFSMSRRLAQASLPILIAFRSTPVAAVAPLIMLFFGRGIMTSVAVVTMVSFFPLLVNVTRGLTAPGGD